MIKIRVRSFGRLSSRNKVSGIRDFTQFEFAESPEVKDVLKRIGIKKPAGLLIMVNDRISTIEKKLDNGDIVKIYPIVIGG